MTGIRELLSAPFDPKKVSWRIGSTNQEKTKGMALAYIDARDVQDRLDEVCGIESWQCRYIPMHDKKTVCEIGIRVRPVTFKGPEMELVDCGEWVWKSDGAGDSDIEAEKGALSDAFKRAAVRWGIGRYLYNLDSPWVAIEPAGRSYKIAQHEYKRLEAILAGKQHATQAAAIHTPHTMPKTDNDPNRLLADAQKAILDTAKELPDVYSWVDKFCGDDIGASVINPMPETGMALLKAGSPALYKELVAHYRAKVEAFSRK